MAGFGNTFKKDLTQFIFRGTALPNAIGTFHIGLHTGDPGPDGQTANEVTTVSTGYARVAVTNNTTNWSTATTANPSVISNLTAITFPTAVTTNWGTVTYFSVWRAAAGSSAITDFIGGQILTASQVINIGNTASFAVGALTHSFTG